MNFHAQIRQTLQMSAGDKPLVHHAERQLHDVRPKARQERVNFVAVVDGDADAIRQTVHLRLYKSTQQIVAVRAEQVTPAMKQERIDIWPVEIV